MDQLACRWCTSANDLDRTTCLRCGAPLEARDLVSGSAWAESPRLRDVTEFEFSNSTGSLEGTVVPIVELSLAEGDAVFFEHDVVLWKDKSLALDAMNFPKGVRRMHRGEPHMVVMAHGPGCIALSRDASGEIVVLPLEPSMGIDVREHALLAGSRSLTYSFVRLASLGSVAYGGAGMYLDRFRTGEVPGLLILHGYGNVFQRVLHSGEKIRVEPGGFLYKDASVGLRAVLQEGLSNQPATVTYLAELTGPGRVGIQSMYVHHDTL